MPGSDNGKGEQTGNKVKIAGYGLAQKS